MKIPQNYQTYTACSVFTSGEKKKVLWRTRNHPENQKQREISQRKITGIKRAGNEQVWDGLGVGEELSTKNHFYKTLEYLKHGYKWLYHWILEILSFNADNYLHVCENIAIMNNICAGWISYMHYEKEIQNIF